MDFINPMKQRGMIICQCSQLIHQCRISNIQKKKEFITNIYILSKAFTCVENIHYCLKVHKEYRNIVNMNAVLIYNK